MEQGKVRVQPHITGSWACHVYISVKLELQELLYGPLRNDYPSIQMEQDVHVSLSKTFYAKHWHLELLHKKLVESLSTHGGLNLTFDKWTVYENEISSRSFLALDCDAATSENIKPLIEMTDRVLAGFGLEQYYKDPKVHASLFWAPGIDISDSILGHPILRDIDWPVGVANAQIMLKMGNRVMMIL